MANDDLAQKYLDFDLEIGRGQGRQYPLVVRSPGGEARAEMYFPFDELALENRLLKLEKALHISSERRRQAPPTQEEQTVQEFGTALFEALLVGDVRTCYEVSLRQAASAKGLRIKLRILAPELARLPWEFLYDARRASYVSQSTRTPVLRYPETPQPVAPLAVQAPLRILAMTASPIDPHLDRLEIDDEKARLERALEPLKRRGVVELKWIEGQTWRDMRDTLQNGPWHIFHFIGHGGFDENADEGLLVLCRDDQRPHPLRASQLALLLADHPHLRLAVLNACEGGRASERDIFSSAASILVRRGLPGVLAMQYPISDRGAIIFSQAFYEALAAGLDVDAAVAAGRQAILMELSLSLEWGVPVLYLRAENGRLFDVRQAAPAQIHQQTSAQSAAETPAPVRPQEQPVEPPHPPPHKPAAPANEETLTLAPGVPMTFVRVPAGPFLMGSTDAQVQESIKRGIREDWVKRQSPQHTVELSEYWIAKTPVTVAQFEAFIKAEKYRTTAEQKGSGWDWTGSQWEEIKGADWRRPRGPKSDMRQKANHPVTQVSWDDAVAFCEWASKVTGRQIRLPSEAEWEKAARGEKGWLYPWGDQAPDEQRCNFNRNVEDTTPVGQYSPQGDSPYGCADMAGNVWEWCSDWYSESTYSRRSKGPVRDPIGPPKGDDRVLRGGSWLNVEVNVRCAYRDRSGPSNRGSDAGFRPARSP